MDVGTAGAAKGDGDLGFSGNSGGFSGEYLDTGKFQEVEKGFLVEAFPNATIKEEHKN